MRKLVRRRRVAILMGLADTYEHGITRGVVRYAKERTDWDLYGYGWMFRPFEAVEVWEGDGIIARIESERAAHRIAALSVPVVDVAGAYRRATFHAVTNDDEETGRRAGAYLLSCGFRRFAYCGVAGTAWSESRRRGFAQAVSRADPRPRVFEAPLPWWERLDNTRRLRSWLSALERPVGIFACNDTAGLKVGEICRDLGIAIPDGVAVMGVDNEDILCEMASPSLSSIELDCEGIGYRAAGLLDRILAGGAPMQRAGRILLLPPRDVVERDSTRIFTCADPLVEQAMRRIRLSSLGGMNVASLVRALATSRRSLETRFNRATGSTVHAEILRVRLSCAKGLLRGTRLTIAAIAAQSGFGSSQRFHECFVASESTTPGRFRRVAAAGASVLAGNDAPPRARMPSWRPQDPG